MFLKMELGKEGEEKQHNCTQCLNASEEPVFGFLLNGMLGSFCWLLGRRAFDLLSFMMVASSCT